MRSSLIALLGCGAWAIVGCSASDRTAPSPVVDATGNYQLTTIINKPLPATVIHELNYGLRRVITSGQLVVASSGGYTVQVSWRDEDEQSGAVVASGTNTGSGRFLVIGDSVHFLDEVENVADPVFSFSPVMIREAQIDSTSLNATVYGFVAQFEKTSH